MGAKWSGGPAAALGQSHRMGQGQVGLELCCRCGLGGCWDLKLMYGLSYFTTIRLILIWVLSKVVKTVFFCLTPHFGFTLVLFCVFLGTFV